MDAQTENDFYHIFMRNGFSLSGLEIAFDLHVRETCMLVAEHCVCMALRSLCLYGTPFIVFV